MLKFLWEFIYDMILKFSHILHSSLYHRNLYQRVSVISFLFFFNKDTHKGIFTFCNHVNEILKKCVDR